jgi:GPH family glycoside/pentoside/hexuronide:cation symporter
MSKKERSSGRKALFYSFGQISDVLSYQSFILLIFTFYFAVVGIGTWLMVLGYSIWSVWNAVNDPMMGFLSDRTHTKLGRRLPYIIGAFIPLAITVIFLYFPPISFGDTSMVANFIYFFIVIVIFELFYTIYSLNLTSLFPEIFMTQQERTQANNIRQVFTIVGLIFALSIIWSHRCSYHCCLRINISYLWSQRTSRIPTGLSKSFRIFRNNKILF